MRYPPRRALTAKTRLRLFTLHGGTCHLCGGRIDGTREAWEIEHGVPLAMGGTDDDANRKPAHVKCHKAKTADDLGRLAKAKRAEARHVGAKPRAGRPMPFGRGSRLKRKVTGAIVARET